MLRLIIYLSKLFLSRWLVTAFGMIILAGLLDSLANASEIAASGVEGGAMRYMWLRLPIIFDLLFLFSLMLALLLTFVSLIRRNELVALQGVGLSVLAQIRALAPVVLAVSIGAMLYIDRALPPSVQALNDWGIGEYQGGNLSSDEPLWLNDGGLFVRIEGRENLNTLTGLTFFQRSEDGYVERVTWAERADYSETGWALKGLSSLIVEGLASEPAEFTRWETSQTPVLIDKLAAEPRDLSMKDLTAFASFRGSGSRPSAAYKVWNVKRMTLPLTALALLVLAAPIMQRLGRRDTGTGALIVGVGATFLFLVLDGIIVTMGTASAFIPVIAAMAATVLIACIGMYLWLQQELMG